MPVEKTRQNKIKHNYFVYTMCDISFKVPILKPNFYLYEVRGAYTVYQRLGIFFVTYTPSNDLNLLLLLSLLLFYATVSNGVNGAWLHEQTMKQHHQIHFPMEHRNEEEINYVRNTE